MRREKRSGGQSRWAESETVKKRHHEKIRIHKIFSYKNKKRKKRKRNERENSHEIWILREKYQKDKKRMIKKENSEQAEKDAKEKFLFSEKKLKKIEMIKKEPQITAPQIAMGLGMT